MAYEVVRQLDTSREDEAQRLSALYLKSPTSRETPKSLMSCSVGRAFVEEARSSKALSCSVKF